MLTETIKSIDLAQLVMVVFVTAVSLPSTIRAVKNMVNWRKG